MTTRHQLEDIPGQRGLVKAAVGLVVAVIVLFLGRAILESNFGYVLHDVRSNEVGILLNSNSPYDVVPPGKYTKFGLFETMETVNVEQLPFEVSDEEVITRDQRRIGVNVKGTVRRPGLDQKDALLANWSGYRQFYLNDNLLLKHRDEKKGITEGLMESLGKQASKVCIGNSFFNDAVIGSGRDLLRACINEELTELARGYGLLISNVVVPNFVLSKELQERLDAITQAQLGEQLANANALKATAEARQQLAVEAGKITVEQGRIQEKSRQDAATAVLEKAAQDAQNQVIVAKKANEFLEAEKNLQIAGVNRLTAEETAKATLAPEIAKAQLMQANPEYARLQMVTQAAGAYSKTDKVIMIPSGVDPLVFLGTGGSNFPVIVPIGSQTQQTRP